jgi:hypothetical protein
MGEMAYMENDKREALALMRRNPANAAILVLRHMEENWLDLRDSPYDFWVSSSLSERLAILGNALFCAACLFGTLVALRAQEEAALPLAMVLMMFPLIFYVTHASLRYRQPMDGIMLVLATYAAGHLLSPLAARFSAAPQTLATSPSAIGADPQ